MCIRDRLVDAKDYAEHASGNARQHRAQSDQRSLHHPEDKLQRRHFAVFFLIHTFVVSFPDKIHSVLYYHLSRRFSTRLVLYSPIWGSIIEKRSQFREACVPEAYRQCLGSHTEIIP